MHRNATEMSADEQSEGEMVLTNPAPRARIYLHRSQKIKSRNLKPESEWI
jgi:hypothetical protein